MNVAFLGRTPEPFPRDKCFGIAGIEALISVKIAACFIGGWTALLDEYDVGLQATRSARVVWKLDDRVLRVDAYVET